MAAAERRRGRRDNGLDATDWRAIEDLDPRVSEDVLDGLGARGIAAYVQPAVDVDPVTRSATLPSSPKDRLYVDRRRAQAAREWIRHVLPERWDEPAREEQVREEPVREDQVREEPAREEQVREEPAREEPARDGTGTSGPAGISSLTGVDATFAGIVAAFDRPVDPAAATWPAAEGLSGRSGSEEEATDTATEFAVPEPPGEPAPAGPVDGRHLTEPTLLDSLDSWDARPDEPDDDDALEEFVPPPPPPLPRLSRQTVLGALAVLAGLVMVLGRPSVLPLDRNAIMLLGFATMVGGAAALILRLRPEPEDGDPAGGRRPDDGAQV